MADNTAILKKCQQCRHANRNSRQFISPAFGKQDTGGGSMDNINENKGICDSTRKVEEKS